MEEFTVIQLTEERGEVQTIVERKSLLHVILSTKKKLTFNPVVFALVLGVIALMTLISMAVVLRKPGEHEKSEKVENLKYILPVSQIAEISNFIGEIKKQKNKKITEKVRNRKSITGSLTSSLTASECSKAKCTFNLLCKNILVSDVNPAEIKRKMTSQKRFDVRVRHETFKTKASLPNFNEENIDTLVKYQLIFHQFIRNLKLIFPKESRTSLPRHFKRFWKQIKELKNKMNHAKNELQTKCGKIPNDSKQNIVYLQGYEDLVIKGYNKEEILFILFNQMNEIFVSLKNDFYKRQICLGDIQCSS